jgi:hypothetical protein
MVASGPGSFGTRALDPSFALSQLDEGRLELRLELIPIGVDG